MLCKKLEEEVVSMKNSENYGRLKVTFKGSTKEKSNKKMSCKEANKTRSNIKGQRMRLRRGL